MGRYACCYSSGRQFVFTERPRWVLAGFFFVALAGLVVGLCLGVTVCLAGVYLFELAMLGVAAFGAYGGYTCIFRRISSSDDLPGYCIALVVGSTLIGLLLFGVRCSLMLDLDAQNRCVLFSASGVVLGLLCYGYMSICCLEDERKHHLGLCGLEGDMLAATLEEDDGEAGPFGGWEALARFISWILSWQWWFDCTCSVSVPADEELPSAEIVTVHNRTLKLIKVCFYSPDDMFCWVPFGGVSGSYVGLIRAQGSRSFSMPKRARVEGKESVFTLKVFQPGVFDKELACCTRVRRGQCLAFCDVEGMVRHSRLLSSASPRSEPTPVHRCPSDSSEDEAMSTRGSSQRLLSLEKGPLRDTHTASTGLSRSGSAGGILRRSSSFGSLAARGGEVRRPACPDEVVVRNRSNQEVRALLFRSNDYCFMVPLVGKMIACGDSILPDAERRFVPRSDEADFTLKVYSVGAGARELTYLTVSRGHTYTFCDSLLS